MARHEMTRRNDEHAWLLETAGKLRDIGMGEAAEYLDEMGRADLLELGSRFSTLHEHLLKLAHASEHERRRNERLWRVTVVNARNAVQRLLKHSPSLRRHLRPVHAETYDGGRRAAEAALARRLPADPPWSHQDALDHEFWPQSHPAPQLSTSKRRRR
jgi:hypothetical protein